MGCTGGVIPGADRTDESNPPKVDEDAMILNNFSVKEEESVVVNKAPEFDGEFMDPEDTPAEEAKRNQAKADHDEKGIHCTNTMSPDIPAQGSKQVLGIAKDNSHVKKRRKCHTEVKDEQKGAGKQLKRKRVPTDGNMNSDDKEFLTAECRREIEELFEYYKDFSGLGLQLDDSECHSNNLMIAYLLEERSLSFSKLVEEIYDKLKGREGITLASVRSTVLFVGQRVMYGISSADADVLEDESESCLWCWETRDIKLFSATLRAIVNIRRIARKKIHERISALCGKNLCLCYATPHIIVCNLWSCHWGIRRNPKMELIKELKLQRPYLLGESPEKMATPMKDASSYEVNNSSESLSDCEKDVEEILDAENLKDEDDIESEDSFVVPDGYLSENEGVQIETSEFPDDEAKVSQCCKLEDDNEEFRTLLQQQKILCTFTEKALRKSQPLVISNLGHEKIELLSAEDLTGKAKVEQVCLQALCMRAIPGGAIVDIFTNPSTSYEDQQVHLAPEESAAQAATAPVVSDKDLPEYVSVVTMYGQIVHSSQFSLFWGP
ncbi:hypothetical protein BHM03_00055040 [Ensete ventricosum]|nr:hypothetical protein BHM03_00055040 [Ensete ventricosum]